MRIRRAPIGLAGLLRCLPLPWSVLPKGPTGNTEGRQGQGSVNSEQPLRGGLARESMILSAGISEPRPFSALLVHLLVSLFRALPFCQSAECCGCSAGLNISGEMPRCNKHVYNQLLTCCVGGPTMIELVMKENSDAHRIHARNDERREVSS